MSRYTPRPTLRCAHAETAAEYDDRMKAHRDAIDAWYDQPYDTRGPRPEPPASPPDYCDACRSALWQPGAVWPPEIWEYLNAMAARDYHGSKPLRPHKLPPPPKARREAIEKLTVRARAAYSADKSITPNDRANIDAAIGTRCGEEKGQPWYIDATNGHTALIRPGAGTKDRQSIRLVGDYGAEWIDLPEAFYLALQRIRIFANDRSEAIRLSHDHGQVKLYARSYELGEASETIIPAAESDRLTEYETHLNASYLDACLGVWPLRWYLRPPVERHDPPTRWQPNGHDWTEEQPQIFEPAGAGWRAVIMPMRV